MLITIWINDLYFNKLLTNHNLVSAMNIKVFKVKNDDHKNGFTTKFPLCVLFHSATISFICYWNPAQSFG